MFRRHDRQLNCTYGVYIVFSGGYTRRLYNTQVGTLRRHRCGVGRYTLARKTAALLIIAAAARGENETQHISTLYLYDIAVCTYIVYIKCLIPRSYTIDV